MKSEQERKEDLKNKTVNSPEADSPESAEIINQIPVLINEQEELVCIGQIIKPHGVKGHFKAIFTLPNCLTLEKLDYLILKKAPFKFKVREAKFVEQNFALIAFKSINSPEAGNEYRGEKIYLPKSFIGELPESEFYIADLIGAEVFDAEKKESIGQVIDFEDIPGNPLLRIKLNEAITDRLILAKASLDQEKNSQIAKKEKKNRKTNDKADKKLNEKNKVFLLPFIDEYVSSIQVDSKQINKTISVQNWEMFLILD